MLVTASPAKRCCLLELVDSAIGLAWIAWVAKLTDKIGRAIHAPGETIGANNSCGAAKPRS
jgi:hypothetical protein